MILRGQSTENAGTVAGAGHVEVEALAQRLGRIFRPGGRRDRIEFAGEHQRGHIAFHRLILQRRRAYAPGLTHVDDVFAAKHRIIGIVCLQ